MIEIGEKIDYLYDCALNKSDEHFISFLLHLKQLEQLDKLSVTDINRLDTLYRVVRKSLGVSDD